MKGREEIAAVTHSSVCVSAAQTSAAAAAAVLTQHAAGRRHQLFTNRRRRRAEKANVVNVREDGEQMAEPSLVHADAWRRGEGLRVGEGNERICFFNFQSL